MSEIRRVGKDAYVAVRGDFILKVDGSRPILYPLDNNDTRVHILTPQEGLIASLLSGKRTMGAVEQLYETLFPDSSPDHVVAILDSLDTLIKENKTASGIGQYGLFEFSSSPIDSVHRFDPREFLIGPQDSEKRFLDYKTKRRLDTPISVLCVFTSRCTTNCAYCYADRKASPELGLERWKELIAEMKDLGIRICSADNGDVFARKEGIDFCEALTENEIHFLLSTKSYVSAEHVRRLVDAGFMNKVNGAVSRTVQLSIDAIDEDVQRRLYRVPPIAGRTAKTLDNFVRYGIFPRIKAVVTGLNFHQPKALVDYFYPRGARQFHFMRYNRSFFNHFDELFLNAGQIEFFKRQFDEIQERYPDTDCWQDVVRPPGATDGQTVEQRKAVWQNRKGCGGGWMLLGIASDGKAFLCEQMPVSADFVVGDLGKQSIMDVWNGRELLDFIHPPRDKFKDASCYSCNEFEQCIWEQGRCYRDAYFCYGTIYDTPPLCPYNTRPGLRIV